MVREEKKKTKYYRFKSAVEMCEIMTKPTSYDEECVSGEELTNPISLRILHDILQTPRIERS